MSSFVYQVLKAFNDEVMAASRQVPSGWSPPCPRVSIAPLGRTPTRSLPLPTELGDTTPAGTERDPHFNYTRVKQTAENETTAEQRWTQDHGRSSVCIRVHLWLPAVPAMTAKFDHFVNLVATK